MPFFFENSPLLRRRPGLFTHIAVACWTSLDSLRAAYFIMQTRQGIVKIGTHRPHKRQLRPWPQSKKVYNFSFK